MSSKDKGSGSQGQGEKYRNPYDPRNNAPEGGEHGSEPPRRKPGGLRSPLLAGEEFEDNDYEEQTPQPRGRGLHSPLLGGGGGGSGSDYDQEPEEPPHAGGLRSPLLGGGSTSYQGIERRTPQAKPFAGQERRSGLRSPMLNNTEFEEDYDEYEDEDDEQRYIEDDDPNVLRSPLFATRRKITKDSPSVQQPKGSNVTSQVKEEPQALKGGASPTSSYSSLRSISTQTANWPGEKQAQVPPVPVRTRIAPGQSAVPPLPNAPPVQQDAPTVNLGGRQAVPLEFSQGQTPAQPSGTLPPGPGTTRPQAYGAQAAPKPASAPAQAAPPQHAPAPPVTPPPAPQEQAPSRAYQERISSDNEESETARGSRGRPRLLSQYADADEEPVSSPYRGSYGRQEQAQSSPALKIVGIAAVALLAVKLYVFSQIMGIPSWANFMPFVIDQIVGVAVIVLLMVVCFLPRN
jgi:hypothetical protein